MKKENNWELSNDFTTFPLFNVENTERDSGVTVPPEADVKEVKDWVDFKEM